MTLPELRSTVPLSARGIAYSDRGEGQPVVLLHGWCLNRQLWMYQEEALARQNRVVCPDLPGFGGSAGVGGPYRLERYGAELLELLLELRLEKAIVAGFAFGAAVAMAAAAEDSSRLAGLVLVGTPSAATAAYDRMPRAMRRDWPEFARRSAVAICKQPQSDATLSWLAAMFGATPLPVALETVALLGAFEPLPLAPRVRVRSLLVHGAQDDVVPVQVSEACAEAMPEARLEVVEQSGHLVVLDQKERLTDLIRSTAQP
jgi:pimeloyl-ACP methyl ester carboxylesterase